jgi:hypothetical protein
MIRIKIGRIRQIPVVQLETHIPLVRILVQVVDAIGVEQRGTALGYHAPYSLFPTGTPPDTRRLAR